MGFFYRIYDTLHYIFTNGWAEYREARKRYDTHARLQSYGDAKFNKKNYVKNLNALKKRK